ncbi:uncharacterized protein LOC128789173 [Vidua chalybeata]|uniref:uncharacterized protein LOC128789173 n=1 Tax=Vidua chalybeata TaxID=81927 RepID=UPI0023A829E1|nr:uncharacterized protein LOC128789173 [Vidua chalybeata]
MEVHLSQPPAPFAEAGNGFNRRLAKADGTTEGKTPIPHETRTIRVRPPLPTPFLPSLPGRRAVTRRWRAAPAGAAAAPSGAAISSPLALSGGAPTRARSRAGPGPPPPPPPGPWGRARGSLRGRRALVPGSAAPAGR